MEKTERDDLLEEARRIGLDMGFVQIHTDAFVCSTEQIWELVHRTIEAYKKGAKDD